MNFSSYNCDLQLVPGCLSCQEDANKCSQCKVGAWHVFVGRAILRDFKQLRVRLVSPKVTMVKFKVLIFLSRVLNQKKKGTWTWAISAHSFGPTESGPCLEGGFGLLDYVDATNVKMQLCIKCSTANCHNCDRDFLTTVAAPWSWFGCGGQWLRRGVVSDLGGYRHVIQYTVQMLMQCQHNLSMYQCTNVF